MQLDYTTNETSSYIVDNISYSMKTKHLFVVTFSMGFIIILISNTGLAFADMHTPQYNAGYAAACNDSKHMNLWDKDGGIWDGFDDKYGSLQENPHWMLGYRDGVICNDMRTPQFNAGFAIGCKDKQAGLLSTNEDGQYNIPAFTNHNRDWITGFTDSAFETSYCPGPK